MIFSFFQMSDSEHQSASDISPAARQQIVNAVLAKLLQQGQSSSSSQDSQGSQAKKLPPAPRTPATALNPDDRDAWEKEGDADRQYRYRLLAKLQICDQKLVRTQMETLVPAIESLERVIKSMNRYDDDDSNLEELRTTRSSLLNRVYMLSIANDLGYSAVER